MVVDRFAAVRLLQIGYDPGDPTPVWVDYGDSRSELEPTRRPGYYVLTPLGPFQTKYFNIAKQANGSLVLTLQNPGRHKYDTLEALYVPAGPNWWRMVGDPVESRQQSSLSQDLKGVGLVAGVFALGYGLALAAAEGVAVTASAAAEGVAAGAEVLTAGEFGALTGAAAETAGAGLVGVEGTLTAAGSSTWLTSSGAAAVDALKAAGNRFVQQLTGKAVETAVVGALLPDGSPAVPDAELATPPAGADVHPAVIVGALVALLAVIA